MDRKIRARYETRAKIMKAMSHPTRLFMVDELAKGKRCVCELTQLVGDDISTISKHLSVLKNVGIVASEKHGTQVHYSLRIPCVLNFFTCAESVLKATLKDHESLLK